MTSSDKQPKPASNPQDPFSKSEILRRISPEEAKRRGIPTIKDLVISPTPKKASKG